MAGGGFPPSGYLSIVSPLGTWAGISASRFRAAGSVSASMNAVTPFWDVQNWDIAAQ